MFTPGASQERRPAKELQEVAQQKRFKAHHTYTHAESPPSDMSEIGCFCSRLNSHGNVQFYRIPPSNQHGYMMAKPPASLPQSIANPFATGCASQDWPFTFPILTMWRPLVPPGFPEIAVQTPVQQIQSLRPLPLETQQSVASNLSAPLRVASCESFIRPTPVEQLQSQVPAVNSKPSCAQQPDLQTELICQKPPLSLERRLKSAEQLTQIPRLSFEERSGSSTCLDQLDLSTRKRKANEITERPETASSGLPFYGKAALESFKDSQRQYHGHVNHRICHDQAKVQGETAIWTQQQPSRPRPRAPVLIANPSHGYTIRLQDLEKRSTQSRPADLCLAPVTPPKFVSQPPTTEPASVPQNFTPFPSVRLSNTLANTIYQQEPLLVWARYMNLCSTTVKLAEDFCERINFQVPMKNTRLITWNEAVTIVGCLWIASKLVEKRSDLAGVSTLARMLQSSMQRDAPIPGYIFISFEISLMQKLDWNPLKGHLE